jgi:hypothetical protein
VINKHFNISVPLQCRNFLELQLNVGTHLAKYITYQPRRQSLLITVGLLGSVLQMTANSSAREQEKYALAGGVADQVLNNVRTVLSFGKQSYEIHR